MVNTACLILFSVCFGEHSHNHKDPILETFSVVFLFILKSCKQDTVRLKCILEIIKIFGVTRGEACSCLLNGVVLGGLYLFPVQVCCVVSRILLYFLL